MTASVQQEEDQRELRAFADFALFWAAYPRKVGKPDAFKAFRAAVRRTPYARIAYGLGQHLPAWERGEKRFIPHPATWLRREGWNDEVVMPSKVNGRKPGGVQQTVDMGRRIMGQMAASTGSDMLENS